MLLSDLAARADLGLRVLHAGHGALDRAVRWVYTTDLSDPARYLGGGELVITGLVWRRGPADSERFVGAVAGSGAIALAAGEAVFGDIPDDVVAACRRHDLVLLAVPVAVSFSAVTEAVIADLTAARGDRLAHTLGRQRRMLSAVAGGVGLDELTGSVSEAIGRTCRVLTAGGVGVAGPPLPDGEPDVVAGTFLGAPRLPAVAGRHVVFPVAPGAEPRVTSWCVAVESDMDTVDGPGTGPGGLDAETADSVGELAAIAALDRRRRREGTRAARALAGDALRSVADGAGDRPETRALLRRAGAEPDGGVSVLVLRAEGGPDPVGTAHTVLVDALTGAGPAAVGTHDGAGVAVLADPDRHGVPEPVLDAIRRLAPGLTDVRLYAGAGRPAGPDALSGALTEATHACALAATRPGPVSVVRAGEIASHVALLAGVPDGLRRAFAAQVLDPVLDYDARTGAGLCATLAEFLEQSGSWSRTAARLHLHVNTVRYRIGRVEDLTGRDLGRFADRVDLYLALRSR